MVKKMLTQNTFNIKDLLILQGLIFLLLTYACKSGSNQNVLSDTKVTISEDSQNKIKELLLKNFKYPVASNKNEVSGHFYISVHIEKGGKIRNISITESEDSIKVPLLKSCHVTIIRSDSWGPTNRSNFVTKDLFAFEEEAIRVTKMLETLSLPEWQEKSTEFAIHFYIK